MYCIRYDEHLSSAEREEQFGEKRVLVQFSRHFVETAATAAHSLTPFCLPVVPWNRYSGHPEYHRRGVKSDLGSFSSLPFSPLFLSLPTHHLSSNSSQATLEGKLILHHSLSVLCLTAPLSSFFLCFSHFLPLSPLFQITKWLVPRRSHAKVLVVKRLGNNLPRK